MLGFWVGSEGFGLLEVAGFFGSGMVLGLVDGYRDFMVQDGTWMNLLVLVE